MNARRIAIALTAVLFVSILLDVLLFVQARQYYVRLNTAPLDPLGLSSYPAGPDPQSPTAGQLRVVFFGDSRAYDWPAPPALVGFEFVNRGIGNQTTAQVHSCFSGNRTSTRVPSPPE